MLQLRILSGKTAGTEWVARRFPVRIGRAVNADLRLEEAGIWDEHVVLSFDRGSGLILQTAPNALASINGEPVSNAVLHNGDGGTGGFTILDRVFDERFVFVEKFDPMRIGRQSDSGRNLRMGRRLHGHNRFCCWCFFVAVVVKNQRTN